ncbi:TPA: hypothetical protein ACGVJP_002070 [Enterococcus faecium]
MVVNKEKVRKYVTLKIASVEYLEKRAKEEEKTRGKKVTVSELLEEWFCCKVLNLLSNKVE